MGFATMKGRASIITSPIINNSLTFVNEKYLNVKNLLFHKGCFRKKYDNNLKPILKSDR